MIDQKSVIIDFYPEDFQVDLNGKKQSWQGVALLPFVDEKRLKKALEAVYDKLSPEEKKRNTRGNDRFFVGKHHKLYDFIKALYEDDGSNKYKNFKHSLDLATSLSNGIAGKIWCDDNVVSEGQTYKSPLGYMCPDIKNNKVVFCHFHDPVYDNEYVFKTNILEGANMPEAVLKPEDFEPNRGYRPNFGYRNNNNDYRNNRNAGPANRMINNSLGQEGVASSAYGGQSSVYGVYKTNNNMPQNSNNNYNNNYNNNNYQQNRGGNNYNSNYNRSNSYNNNNNNNNNYNRNNSYNNNRNYNYNDGNGGNNNGNNFNRNNSYNNNNRNNNYNNNNNNGNKPNNNNRYPDNNNQSNNNNNNQQRSYNRNQ